MNKKDFWQTILSDLQVSVSPPIFQTLFSQTELQSIEKNIATIACPNPYIQKMIEGRYYSLLKETLDRRTKKDNSLLFTINKTRKKEKLEDAGPLFEDQSQKAKKKVFDKETGLNPRYSFTTFVVGNSNNFAHAAAQAIVQTPGAAYNPFFIWGGVGVGKTHLMQAIGHAITEQHQDLKVLYCSSETFTNELVSALQSKTMSRFKEKYRGVDVLLVDDIQFIAGKEYSQEEFFHTFNTLHLSGKQIILTSDRRPEEIPKTEERLTSRFLGGLTVDIQPPDYEMRVAIIKQKCQEKDGQMEEQAIDFLAQRITTNARELEGTLFRVLTQAKVEQQKPNLEFVKKFLGVKTKTESKKVSPKKLVSIVCQHYKIKTVDLFGSCRKANLVLPRQVTMYLLREDLGLPLMAIGDILGGRDHTTIMHGVEKIKQRFNADSDLRHEIMLIKEALYE
jgi:chromosomal replication initiator protein